MARIFFLLFEYPTCNSNTFGFNCTKDDKSILDWLKYIFIFSYAQYIPSGLLFLVLRCTSSASSKTRFIYSSKPYKNTIILSCISFPNFKCWRHNNYANNFQPIQAIGSDHLRNSSWLLIRGIIFLYAARIIGINRRVFAYVSS